jgi:hypothetical protein
MYKAELSSSSAQTKLMPLWCNKYSLEENFRHQRQTARNEVEKPWEKIDGTTKKAAVGR